MNLQTLFWVNYSHKKVTYKGKQEKEDVFLIYINFMIHVYIIDSNIRHESSPQFSNQFPTPNYQKKHQPIWPFKKASFLQKIDEIVENCGVLVSEYHVKVGFMVGTVSKPTTGTCREVHLQQGSWGAWNPFLFWKSNNANVNLKDFPKVIS